ncbi:hypothetical protein FRC17_007437 [Serendipita sp. 399]|nr:hypothetical protein FRC17_007437 [Serendipita sp. 399]
MDSQVPPGLESLLDGIDYKIVEEGGSGSWMEYPAVKRFTNAFLVDEGANKEEAQVQAPLRHCGFLFFYEKGHEYAHEIDLYRAETWTGEPTEWVFCFDVQK